MAEDCIGSIGWKRTSQAPPARRRARSDGDARPASGAGHATGIRRRIASSQQERQSPDPKDGDCAVCRGRRQDQPCSVADAQVDHGSPATAPSRLTRSPVADGRQPPLTCSRRCTPNAAGAPTRPATDAHAPGQRRRLRPQPPSPPRPPAELLRPPPAPATRSSAGRPLRSRRRGAIQAAGVDDRGRGTWPAPPGRGRSGELPDHQGAVGAAEAERIGYRDYRSASAAPRWRSSPGRTRDPG